MRAAILLCLALLPFILVADGPGVTSRVRITADESNRDWEKTFFGDRLNAMHKEAQIPDDQSTDTDAVIVEKERTKKTTDKKLLKGKRTVEFHIVQEESEEGNGSRKVKKRVIIEKEHPDAPPPEK